jgi:DNA replication protein DnaC
MSAAIDATRLSFLLNELRLPAIKHAWAKFAERSDKEGWTGARFLAVIAEHELAERDRRRVERHRPPRARFQTIEYIKFLLHSSNPLMSLASRGILIA